MAKKKSNRNNWAEIIERLLNTKSKRKTITMGTPESASVTACRVRDNYGDVVDVEVKGAKLILQG